MVPEPLCALLGALDADAVVGAEHLLLLLGRRARQVFGETGAHDDDVALLERRALVLGRRLEVGDRDLVRREGRVFDPLLRRVGLVVDQYPAAHQAASVVPVCEPGIQPVRQNAMVGVEVEIGSNSRSRVGRDLDMSTLPKSWVNSLTEVCTPL